MLTAIIVDDEEQSIIVLRNFLETYCADIVKLVSVSSNINDAFQNIQILKPNIVFLDVDMPPYTGFDLLRRFETIDFETIFVTAYNHYAIEAIKFSALYYILKPIKLNDLMDSISRAIQRFKDDKFTTNSHFKEVLENPNEITKIVINVKSGFKILEIEEILYLQADGPYTLFFSVSGSKNISSKVLNEYEIMLHTKGFFRVHKSYLINMKYIKELDKTNSEIILFNGARIPLADRRRVLFAEICKKYFMR